MSTRRESKWSYSRVSMFDTCPKQYEGHYITGKYKKVFQGKQAERGDKLHGHAQLFVEGKARTLHKELKDFKKEFSTLKRICKNGNGHCEPDVSYNSKLKPDGFWDTDYYMGKADFVHFDGSEATIIDYKTGKIYDHHKEQAHCYATAVFLQDDKIKTVYVEFWYIDQDHIETFEYKRRNLTTMIAKWGSKVKKMYSTTRFMKRPNSYCNFCPRHVKNKGDCQP